jgi:serine/threonine protein kinase
MTDLGIARVWKPENQQDTSGTPGYMAPEVMCRQNHGVAADYYAVGVIVYECMVISNIYVDGKKTLPWKVSLRNKRSNFGQASTNKEGRYP